MLLFDGRGGCGIDGLVDPPTEVGDLPGRGVDVDLHMLRLSVRGDKCGAGPLPGTTYPRDDLMVPRDHWEAVVSCRLTDALARSTTATAARATAVMMTGR